MESISPAVATLTSAVLVGFGSHFMVEDYRRFRDSKTIAAGLAGELESITLSLPKLLPGLYMMKTMLDDQEKISLPEMPHQSSPIFEANTEKVGLLGTKLVGEVAFIYDQIRAFRTAYQLLSKHHTTMDAPWSSLLVGSCIELIETNKSRAEILIEHLKRHSDACYGSSRWLGMAILSGLTAVCLAMLFGAVFCARPT